MTPEREREIREYAASEEPPDMQRRDWLAATLRRDGRTAAIDLLDEIDRLRGDFRAESLARSRTVGALADAREEIDRLRRLPVIATCGECGYESLTSDADGYEASVCTKSWPRQWLLVRADKEPPEWCPLRGAR